MRLNIQEVCTRLEEDIKKTKGKGRIQFSLSGVSTNLKSTSLAGDFFDDWVKCWLDTNNIDYTILAEDYSEFADFKFSSNGELRELLCIKAFDLKKSHSFSIVNFEHYLDALKQSPCLLDINYIIFGYTISDDGILTIKNLWNKKIWDITCPMQNWPLNLEIGGNRISQIKSGCFFRKNTKFPIFKGKFKFLSALLESMYQYPKTRYEVGAWKDSFESSYRECYGVILKIEKGEDGIFHFIEKYSFDTTKTNLEELDKYMNMSEEIDYDYYLGVVEDSPECISSNSQKDNSIDDDDDDDDDDRDIAI